jgi:hypothetical protein
MIAWLHHAPVWATTQHQGYLRFSWARLRRRMRFFRHFQRMWPRFFQTREPLFMLRAPKPLFWGRRRRFPVLYLS